MQGLSEELEETAGSAGPQPGVDVERRVEIHSRPVNVVLVGPGATPKRALALWRCVLGDLRTREIEAGPAGFQVEREEGL